MKIQPSEYVKKLDVIDAPIAHKWNVEIACQFSRKENIKLTDAIDKCSYKAKMAIGALLSEIIAWRFSKHTETKDAFQRIEAAWCCAIDPYYAKEIDFDFSTIDGKSIQNSLPHQGALEMSLEHLFVIHMRYAHQDVYLAAAVAVQALMAQHITPKKKAFSAWFSDTLRKTADIFPRRIDEDDFYELDSYDCSHEPPCFREFFEPNFEYTEKSVSEAINRFLQSLKPNDNPYLRSPEEMKAAGFPGTPYTY